MTLEQLEKIVLGKQNLNLTSKVKLLEEDGGGFMAALDIFHILHCLVRTHVVGGSLALTSNLNIYLKNTIRKYTYLDYYGTVDIALAEASPLVFKIHPGE